MIPSLTTQSQEPTEKDMSLEEALRVLLRILTDLEQIGVPRG